MLKNKIEIEKPYKIVDIVEKILNQNKKRQGLKTLTPKQMLIRLPTSVA